MYLPFLNNSGHSLNSLFCRLNNCSSEKEWAEKMEKLTTMDLQELIKLEEQKCTRTTPAELYYVKKEEWVFRYLKNEKPS